MYSQIEIPPKSNQIVESEDGSVRFIIEETDHLRISRVTVIRNVEEAAWEEQAETG